MRLRTEWIGCVSREPIWAEKGLNLIMSLLDALGDDGESGRLQADLDQVIDEEERRKADGTSRM